MTSKSFARSNFSETQLNDTSMSLISHITKVICVEGYFEDATIGYRNVGSACKLDERIISLVDRMIGLSSLGTVEEAWKTYEAVGMV